MNTSSLQTLASNEHPTPAGLRTACRIDGAIAMLELFNPPQGLMDEAMESELWQWLEHLDDRSRWPEGRVVILTGREPGVFVRHYDVAALFQRAQALRERGKTFTLERLVPAAGIHRCIERIERSPLVFIAVLNGTAMGGGFELALGCDLRLVERGDFQFGLPEANLGLLPGAGGTQKLAAMLGTARALDLMLNARVLSGPDLKELGLVSACVNDARTQALATARRITALPPRACAHIKALVRQAPTWTQEHGAAVERTLFCDCLVDPAAQPLMRDVVEGRRTIADPPADC
jgi:enoyl-CoA hydratase/carnithine racemase